MSETNRIQVDRSVDSLRDRIAAACQSADQRLAVEDEMPIGVYYAALADAVIAELGLKQISETGEIADRDGGEPIKYGRYRYVTDWKADDE